MSSRRQQLLLHVYNEHLGKLPQVDAGWLEMEPHREVVAQEASPGERRPATATTMSVVSIAGRAISAECWSITAQWHFW